MLPKSLHLRAEAALGSLTADDSCVPHLLLLCPFMKPLHSGDTPDHVPLLSAAPKALYFGVNQNGIGVWAHFGTREVW